MQRLSDVVRAGLLTEGIEANEGLFGYLGKAPGNLGGFEEAPVEGHPVNFSDPRPAPIRFVANQKLLARPIAQRSGDVTLL